MRENIPRNAFITAKGLSSSSSKGLELRRPAIGMEENGSYKQYSQVKEEETDLRKCGFGKEYKMKFW